jgi:hypothetical protein
LHYVGRFNNATSVFVVLSKDATKPWELGLCEPYYELETEAEEMCKQLNLTADKTIAPYFVGTKLLYDF